MEDCRSCPNVATSQRREFPTSRRSHVVTSLGLFANPTHLAFGKQSLLGFLRKKVLMTRGSHFRGCG